jgi:hypothetical protein
MALGGGWLDSEDLIEFLSGWAAKPRFAGLVSTDPALVSDPLTVEVLGDAYRRVLNVGFTLSSLLLRNSIQWQWFGLAAGTRVSGFAIWDSAFNGRVKAYAPLDAPIDFPAGGNYSVPAGEVFIGIDS